MEGGKKYFRLVNRNILLNHLLYTFLGDYYMSLEKRRRTAERTSARTINHTGSILSLAYPSFPEVFDNWDSHEAEAELYFQEIQETRTKQNPKPTWYRLWKGLITGMFHLCRQKVVVGVECLPVLSPCKFLSASAGLCHWYCLVLHGHQIPPAHCIFLMNCN